MSQAFPATQSLPPRGFLQYDPANTNYQQILMDVYDGTGAGGQGGTTVNQPIKDWVKNVLITCPVAVRVAHRGTGVADNAVIGAVADFQVIAAGVPTVIPLRDGLPVFLSGVNTNVIELVALGMNVSVA